MHQLYIDMDGTLVDFEAGISSVTKRQRKKYEDEYDEIPGFFDDLPPVEGAIKAYHRLAAVYDTYILSTAPWNNAKAWSAKNRWVRKYLPEVANRRLILNHHKELVRGGILIDDRKTHGVEQFEGEHIHFGSERYPDWDAVLDYLIL